MAKPYATTPRELLADRGIAHTAKTLYGVLTKFADRNRVAWPSQHTLAMELGCSLPTVKRNVAELRDAGWITVSRRRPGGGNEYMLNEEPVIEDPGESGEDELEAPERDCEASNDGVRALTPRITDEPTHGSKLIPLSYRYLENETPLAPAGALRTSESIEELEHTGFDPLEACGMFGTGPVRAPAKTPGARALAYELRESWARTHAGALPGDINVKAVAGQIASLMRGGVTAVEMRSMISLYCDSDGYQVKGAPPWKTFLARRHVLLLRVRTYAEALAAESDPDYWAPKPVDDMAESRRWLAEQMGITAA